MKVSDYKVLYTSEAEEILQSLEHGVIGLEGEGDTKACIEELFRNAHNLKGISGAMGYDFVVEASHTLENVLDRLRKHNMKLSPSKVSLMLTAIDYLRKLVQCTVEDTGGADGEDLLAEILVALSPMCEKPVCGDDGQEAPETAAASDPDDPRQDEKSRATGESAGDVEVQNAAVQPASDDNKQRSPGEVQSPGMTSIRMELTRLDRLMDLVGELMISRIRLSGIARDLGSKLLIDELESSSRLISEIQKEVMEARLIPVGQIFQRFKRMVRDVSSELNKKVELRLVGSEIGLDRTVLESMIDPFVHLIRNAIDHGIEPPEEREAADKNPCGTIELCARRERNYVVLEVSDDGRGIDTDRIMKTEGAGTAGAAAGADLNDDELCRILATPGFSTSRKVGIYSGRGMGMNIVKNTIDSFGGSMRLSSKPGKGTLVSMQLPVNLSIIKALLFRVNDEVHALPIEYVKETTRMELASLRSYRGREVLETKEGFLPVVRPWEVLGSSEDEEGVRYVKVIIVDTGQGNVGLIVNRIVGQQEIVIKGLPEMLKGINGISGATILGSGKISFIWDPRVLFQGGFIDELHNEAIILKN